ncbi:MAG: galactokinase [Gemmatimonadales bacterium]
MKPDERARKRFTSEFGHPPAALAAAPGRVNLIGEHVDLYGGHVLPVATTWRTAVAVGPGSGRLRAVSEQGARVETDWPPRRAGQWSDYVAGVAALWTGVPFEGGLDVAVASDVPLSSGVSSSAALEVATAFALAALTGTRAAPRDLAELAWRAEIEFVGMPCGRMDQYASALAPRGAALLLDCRSYAMSSVRVDLDLVLADSGESRALRSSAYAERRAECEEALRILQTEHPALEVLVDVPPARLAALAAGLPEPLGRRVRHVVNENQRALLAAQALESGDHAAFGLLVNASHASLRDLYECSTPRLDAIAEAARALPHALGARLVGAGWGGWVLIAAERGSGGAVADRLSADRTLAVPAVHVVQPGVGAGEA